MSGDGHQTVAHADAGRTQLLIDSVDVAVEAYLGQRVMTVGELKGLSRDGVVVLDAALDAVIELRVNGVAIAHGELVAVGDRFGVRVTAVSG